MKYLKYSLIAATVALTSACQSLAPQSAEPEMNKSAAATVAVKPVKKEKQKQEQVKSEINNHQLFEVHTDGRIYFFYDYAAYQDFLKLGHTPFVLTKIGEGPKGETLVYALNSEDKKKRSGIVSVDMMEGRVAPAEDFYAEMNMEGRTYVFNRFEDMSAVRKLGEAPYRHAKIAYGVHGESVIFVLNDSNKTIYPEALINKYDALNK